MALNNSGKISLAGSTAGESIAAELGLGATTQISLNDVDVRALAGVASGFITMPLDFWGKSAGGGYWIGYFSGFSAVNPATGWALPFFDSSGNMYFSTNTTTTQTTCIVRMSPQNVVLSACTVDTTNGGVIVGSDDNVYLLGNKTNGTYARCSIVKISGDLSTYISQYGFNYGSGSPAANTQSLQSTIYYQARNTFGKIVGYGSRPRGQVFDNNLTSLYTFGSYNAIGTYGYSGAVDGLGNWYSQDFRSGVGAFIGKWNTSNVNQWAKIINGLHESRYCAASATGRCVISGELNGTGYPYIMAFDENGNALWSRQLSTANTGFPVTVNYDSSGNIYALAYVSNTSFDSFLYKFDSNGNLIWQRNFNGGTFRVGGFRIGPDDAMYITLINQVVMKLPNDGSLMGVYTANGTTLTYSAGTQTIVNLGLTASNATPATFDPKTLFSWTITRTTVSGSFSKQDI